MPAFQNLGGFSTPTPVAPGSRGAPNWGATFRADFFDKPNFLAAVREEIFHACAFLRSGIILPDSRLDASEGGVSVTLPHTLPFDPSEEVIESNATWGAGGEGALTVQKLNARLQVYPILHRGFGVGCDDLSKLASGLDPMGVAAGYLGPALAKHDTATLLAMLSGVFGTALSGNTLDVTRSGAGTSNEANFLTASTVSRAKTRLGERAGALRYIAMHSDVVRYLETIGMLTFSTSSLAAAGAIAWGAGGVGISNTDVPYFAGLQVVTDDLLAPTIDATNGDKYPVYLFAPGSVLMGMQQPLRVEYQRRPAAKQDAMYPDKHFAFGIPGLTYTGTLGSPTNTNLSTAGNWSLSFTERKMIPIIRMRVNCPFATNP